VTGRSASAPAEARPLASGFGRLVAGRVVSALVHSTLIAAFVAAAQDMAPEERRAAWGGRR